MKVVLLRVAPRVATLTKSAWRIGLTTLAIAIASACAGPAAAEDLSFPSEHHPWGRFPVGSWKQVRTTSETLDSKGKITNIAVTDTRTTLIAADESTYTLRTEVTLDVGGRRIATTPQVAKYGYYGESPGQGVSAKHVSDGPLVIDGRSIPCEVRQIIVESSGSKLTSTLHYSPQVAPFVLRRDTSVEGGSEDKRSSSLVEVVALDLPQRVRGELKQASYVKTTYKLPQVTKVTLEVHCEDVPGSVAAHWASETDAGGRLVRRSTLELIGYAVPTPVEEPAVGLPRRLHRANKAARRMESR
jgi:hypothetical protein